MYLPFSQILLKERVCHFVYIEAQKRIIGIMCSFLLRMNNTFFWNLVKTNLFQKRWHLTFLGSCANIYIFFPIPQLNLDQMISPDTDKCCHEGLLMLYCQCLSHQTQAWQTYIFIIWMEQIINMHSSPRTRDQVNIHIPALPSTNKTTSSSSYYQLTLRSWNVTWIIVTDV